MVTVLYCQIFLWKPGVHCVYQCQQSWASWDWYTGKNQFNKQSRSRAWETWTFHQSSNIARSTGVKLHTFSSIYTLLERARWVCKNVYHDQGLNPKWIFFLKIDHSGAWQTQTLHQSSNIACSYVVKSETFLVSILQLEIYMSSRKWLSWSGLEPHIQYFSKYECSGAWQTQTLHHSS